MSKLYDFLDHVARFLRVLIVMIILLLMWIFCVQTLHGQEVPLVRVQHDAFISYYDLQTHNPALVVYPLEYRHFSGSYKVSGRHFKADTKLPRPRVMDGDYSKSGYVRGHLCSAGDRDSDKSWLKETYLTSNLVPMTMVCNSGQWKMIEDSCRALAKAGHRLLVGRGPLYRDIGSGTRNVIRDRVCITIPDGLFCVAKCQDCDLKYFDWCPNAAADLLQDVIQKEPGCFCDTHPFVLDNRVSVLIQKIFGLWFREVYETITR